MSAPVKWSLGFFDNNHHAVEGEVDPHASGWESICGMFCITCPQLIIDSEGLTPCPKCCAAVKARRETIELIEAVEGAQRHAHEKPLQLD